MLSGIKLKEYRQIRQMSISDLEAIIPVNQRGNALKTRKEFISAVRNWERGLLKPKPTREDIESLSRALHVDVQDICVWPASHMFAPIAPRKARLVTEMIAGLPAQDALDVLKFANKRAAVMVEKVLVSAIANADEQEADVESLRVCEARVDEGGIRRGTRRWRPKDRGRAVPFTRLASHIHVCLEVD